MLARSSRRWRRQHTPQRIEKQVRLFAFGLHLRSDLLRQRCIDRCQWPASRLRDDQMQAGALQVVQIVVRMRDGGARDDCRSTARTVMRYTAPWMKRAVGSARWRLASTLPRTSNNTTFSGPVSLQCSPRRVITWRSCAPGKSTLQWLQTASAAMRDVMGVIEAIDAIDVAGRALITCAPRRCMQPRTPSLYRGPPQLLCRACTATIRCRNR